MSPWGAQKTIPGMSLSRALFESRAGSLLKWGAFIYFFLSSISFQPQELQLVFVSIERRKTATHSITGN